MNIKEAADYWRNQKLYVTHHHNSRGLGIFASRLIKKGEVIFVFKGMEMRAEYDDYWEGEELWIQIEHKRWIEPEGYGKRINHSCNPNSAIFNSTKLKAIKDIKPNEEISVDYDATEWDNSMHQAFICKCGGKNCRGIIPGYKYLPEIWKRFYKKMGITPKYLLELESRQNANKISLQ